MKLYDAIALFRGECPIGKAFDDCVLNAALDARHPYNAIAQKLLDAEELFLSPTERTLRQLQNPRLRLQQTDLPDGITGIIEGELPTGYVKWETTSSKPFDLNAVYIRSLL